MLGVKKSTMIAKGRRALNEMTKQLATSHSRPIFMYASEQPELTITPLPIKERVVNFAGSEVFYGNVIRAVAPIGHRNVDYAIFNALRKGMAKEHRGGIHIFPLNSWLTNSSGYNIALMAPNPADFNKRKGYVHLVDSDQFSLDTQMHTYTKPSYPTPYSYVSTEEINPLAIIEVGIDDLFSHIWTVKDSMTESDKMRRNAILSR